MSEQNKLFENFKNWNKALIWSCLQGHMGHIILNDEQLPSAAQLVIGDFCFYAGIPNEKLIREAKAPIIIPNNQDWEILIEEVLQGSIKKMQRFAIKKENDIFDIQKLKGYVDCLEDHFTLSMIDEDIYHLLMQEEWSKDLCAQFKHYNDFHQRGLGFVVMHNDMPVSGAASYVVYDTGIEIEIDTNPAFRQKGLATACGARLVLECLEKNLYPSWDAHDLRSVALAEKLGYHIDAPYTAYVKM